MGRSGAHETITAQLWLYFIESVRAGVRHIKVLKLTPAFEGMTNKQVPLDSYRSASL
jgi:hypothetical protein